MSSAPLTDDIHTVYIRIYIYNVKICQNTSVGQCFTCQFGRHQKTEGRFYLCNDQSVNRLTEI